MMLLSGILQKQASHESNQAVLLCDWGTFTIFDANVNGIDSGEHPVMFEFKNITMKSKITGQGQSMTYLVANLKQLVFHNSCQKPVKQSKLRLVETGKDHDEIQVELPLETKNESTISEHTEKVEDIQAKPLNVDIIPRRDDAEDEDLFGELWPLEDVVSLDSSLERGKLRQQMAALEERGYVYESDQRIWVHNTLSHREYAN